MSKDFIKVDDWDSLCKHTLWDRIVQRFYAIADFRYTIMHAYKRVVYGYDDLAVFNMNDHLCKLIPSLIKEMKKHITGYPSSLMESGFDDYDEKLHLQWQKILSDISLGFEEMDKKMDLQEYDQNKIDKGFSLFKEHFESLWH